MGAISHVTSSVKEYFQNTAQHLDPTLEYLGLMLNSGTWFQLAARADPGRQQ